MNLLTLEIGFFNNINNHLAWVEINSFGSLVNIYHKRQAKQSLKYNSGLSFKYCLFSFMCLSFFAGAFKAGHFQYVSCSI